MTTEICYEYNISSDPPTPALLGSTIKEDFVKEHLGKTYHSVGCSYSDFCLQHYSQLKRQE